MLNLRYTLCPLRTLRAADCLAGEQLAECRLVPYTPRDTAGHRGIRATILPKNKCCERKVVDGNSSRGHRRVVHTASDNRPAEGAPGRAPSTGRTDVRPRGERDEENSPNHSHYGCAYHTKETRDESRLRTNGSDTTSVRGTWWVQYVGGRGSLGGTGVA